MPHQHIDDLEYNYPGWLDAILTNQSRWLDSRLRKRYAVPFATPYPDTAKGWLAAIVTRLAYLKRGVDPDDLQFVEINNLAATAKTEVLEAANSDDGWFDLPDNAGESASGITQGSPRSYSEQSPYVWTDRQRETAIVEDESGSGTYG